MRRFYIAMVWLAVVVTVFTCLSWLYLYLNHVPLSKPASTMQTLNLPTTAPSIWNMTMPIVAGTWWLPVVVLIVQVFITGGFYGTLVRVNTGTAASAGSFLSDALRAFWRLLGWNLVWMLLSLFVIGLYRLSAPLSIALSILLIFGRYVFLFSDVALVCEMQAPMQQALKNAALALLNGIVPMLPYGVCTMIFTGFAMTLTDYLSMTDLLWVGILYGLVMTWIAHMITARYLALSDWQARAVGGERI
ncbi:hypothetical protein JI721_04300 [Alicyclobacillus cycloheptanicus]|uniref:Membrane protein n=1 Tax=Alicyclobacillus cycloheptanicus TaxID=1457 RepID=A0ABT9XIE4_9BACL|nr:hypothetical protein [Alicyclobacillus cycloheptanicus]MDQ0190076.1 putative membrane protein [Alicyclobacillus cycloheptanicus]WDM02054.1 hypothetical protein JI721_04300 [Alicyclobacillus cycloheptanicus]